MLFDCGLIRRGMRFFPKPPRGFQGIDLYALPPRNFVAGLVQLAMMTAAQRHGELVADLKTERSRLRKAQVMWI